VSSVVLCALFWCITTYFGNENLDLSYAKQSHVLNFTYTVKMNMLYLINRIVATDYKQY